MRPKPIAYSVVVAIAVLIPTAGHAEAGPEDQAQEILDQTGIKRGLIVHIGCGDGKLTAALLRDNSSIVQGLDADVKNVTAARSRLTEAGLYGPVSVAMFDGTRLPYADNLVNLVVADAPIAVSQEEIFRILAPGGVAYLKSDGKWRKTVKSWPEDMDEWTHFLHAADGNAVSRDKLAGKPNNLRWVADPKYSRHHDEVLALSAMVAGGGRIFSIVDEAPPSTFHPQIGGKFFLIARDAFNGLELWRKPIKDWGWPSWSGRQNVRFSQPIQLPKRMVVDGNRLYVTMGWNAPLSVLDAETGKLIKVLIKGEYADELLVCDGKLIVSLYDKPVRPVPHPAGKGQPGKADSKGRGIRKKIAVLDPETGRRLWESEWLDGLRGRFDAVSPQSHLELTARSGRVFAITTDKIVCYALKDGRQLWTRPRPDHPTHRMRLGVNMSDNCTVVADDERLYVVQPVGKLRSNFHTIPCDLYAYDAKSGKQLWMIKRKIGSFAWGIHADLFLIGGKLWTHEHIENRMRGPNPVDQSSIKYALLAIDPETGKILRRIDTKKIFNIGHHHRCYRNKATERFVFTARRGTELIDIDSGKLHVNHWLRGECRFGMVPANGLLYSPPDPCSCHARIKVNGMLALAEAVEPGADMSPRLVKGPAFGKVLPLAAGPDDWPAHRGNSRRQGYAAQALGSLSPAWKVDLGDTITQATCVGDQVFVACKDTHQIKTFSLKDGKPGWSVTVSGRIDSAPTFHKGNLLFGTSNGQVYCLRASDGQLAWKFRAAPKTKLIMARGQLESSWPVRGSILVHEGMAYVLAGRSSYLDGGLHAFVLNVAKGEIRKQRRIRNSHTNESRPYSGQTQDADGALNHLLVSDGKTVHLQSKPLFKTDTGIAAARPFLMATCGMLDDWMFNRFGWGFVGASGSTGALVVHDDNRLYATRATKRFNRKSTFIVGSGYSLLEAKLPANPETYAVFEKNAFALLGYRERKIKSNWQRQIPVRGQAMLLTSNTLLVAGLPDEIDEADPYATFEGRKGGKLIMIDRKTGKTLNETMLDSPPVWDGISCASRRVLLAQENGKLVCFRCEENVQQQNEPCKK